MDMQDKGIKV